MALKMSEIGESIKRVKEKIYHAARKASTDPEKIVLIAVSKGVDLERMEQAVAEGIINFGENFLQEAVKKHPFFSNHPQLKWHFIGHLQKNKVKKVVKYFDMIQSVDSFPLAELISRCAEEMNKIMEVLIQIKLAPEETKYGLLPEELTEFLERASTLNNIKIKGLMTIPPYFSDPQKVRPYFKTMRNLAEIINKGDYPFMEMKYLSMGMSGDFEVAIEEGANMVRIGRDIFGWRQ